MAHIGTAHEVENGYHGVIFLPPLFNDDIRIVKVSNPGATSRTPSHRIYFDKWEIGCAWPVTKTDSNDLLSLRFDFPGLVAPIQATLAKDDRGGDFVVYWYRKKEKKPE